MHAVIVSHSWEDSRSSTVLFISTYRLEVHINTIHIVGLEKQVCPWWRSITTCPSNHLNSKHNVNHYNDLNWISIAPHYDIYLVQLRYGTWKAIDHHNLNIRNVNALNNREASHGNALKKCNTNIHTIPNATVATRHLSSDDGEETGCIESLETIWKWCMIHTNRMLVFHCLL